MARDGAMNYHFMGVGSAKHAALIVPQGTKTVLKNHSKMSDLSGSIQPNPNPTMASVCSLGR